jgi:hypothetical protein
VISLEGEGATDASSTDSTLPAAPFGPTALVVLGVSVAIDGSACPGLTISANGPDRCRRNAPYSGSRLGTIRSIATRTSDRFPELTRRSPILSRVACEHAGRRVRTASTRLKDRSEAVLVCSSDQ